MDVVVAEDFTAGGDDGRGEAVDEGDYFGFVVFATNSQVERFVAPAETDSALVDGVVANSPKVWVVGASGLCFRDQVVSLVRCLSVDRAVRSRSVVMLGETIKLLLQLGESVGAWLGGQPLFEGFPGPLDFALSGGSVRAPVFPKDALEL